MDRKNKPTGKKRKYKRERDVKRMPRREIRERQKSWGKKIEE